MFDGFFGNRLSPWKPGELGLTDRPFTPSVDLKETDNEFIVTAEVPGVPKEGLDVTITEGAVTLKGERREEKENNEEGYRFKETSYGAFHRVIPLPGEVLAEKAKAALKDGVLTLTLPKSEHSKPRAIQIDVH
jgi:HSP20 family protein